MHFFYWCSSQNGVFGNTLLVRWTNTPVFGAHLILDNSMVKWFKKEFKLFPFFCLTFPKRASYTANNLVASNCLRNEVLSYCQLAINPDVINLNHFFTPLLRVTTNTLHFSKSDTMCNSIRSLKWSKWSFGPTFPSYALMFRSLNHLGNGASRISLLKGDHLAGATSSSSCSSISTIALCRSSNGIFLIPCELASVGMFSAIECYEHSCSRLLFKVSLIFTPLPSLLNVFPDVFFPWLLSPICTTSERLWQMGTCSTIPRVNTHMLRPHSHQVHTYPLWGCNSLPTRRLISPRTSWYWTLGRLLSTLLGASINIWGSSLFSSSSLVLLYRFVEGLHLQTLCHMHHHGFRSLYPHCVQH